ncbi:SEC14-like protein 1 [Nymphon striatum]|nr:SEC14-like protein 1 [Nymphon striatum]
MVQKYQSPVRVYKYPFELVMAAYEKRFPTCKMIPVFVGSDILSDIKSEDGSTHAVERRCKLNVDAPYLLKKIVGVDYVYFIQKNELDRRARTLKIEAYNESFSSRIVINEKCFYFVHPENNDWTCFEQSASLDIKSFFGFESNVEKLAMKQYAHNIQKGKEVIEYYINELINDGVTHIGQFEANSNNSNSSKVPHIKVSRSDSELLNSSTMYTEKGAFDVSVSTTSTHDGHLPSEDSNFKLDSEYIERCLGELTPVQEFRLMQLRNWVAETHKGKIPNDTTLLRFLRAREFSFEKSREMLTSSLVWRKKHQVDRILRDYTLPTVVKKYFPGEWHNYDNAGRPLFILRVGQMDVKGLIKSIGEEGLLKLTLYICEEGLRQAEESTRRLGKPVSSISCIVDFEGLNMRHLWRPGVRALLRIIEIVEANYPETLGRVFIVKAPRVFPILWTLVSTFINEDTKSKFMFHSGTECFCTPGSGGLVDYIERSEIPDFLGGECKAPICGGGLIPKTMYMSEEEYEKMRCEDNPLCEDSIYQSVSLSKGQVHEIVIQNDDIGSVICWDFDVMKEDILFLVLKTSRPLPIDPSNPPIPPSSMVGSPSADSPSSFLDKNFVQGKDYTVVENPLICHDGESIQGSHVTSHKGTYILQWKYLEPTHHSHHSFDFTLTSHKAKVMFYYEVLKSREFKNYIDMLSLSIVMVTMNMRFYVFITSHVKAGFSAMSIGTTASCQSSQSTSSSCPSR